VHEIRDWDDLRRRIDPPDRRCYAFFHPALVDEPLIFVELALTREIPAAIAPILSGKREAVEPERATTATFYSITNCQRGLAGVTFGHFLIKQVVEDLSREVPRVSSFVTLSPAPNFAEWLERERANEASLALDEEDRDALAALDSANWWRVPEVAETVREPLLRAAAWYYVRGRNSRGLPVDAVARFHLGNGARLERLDWLADTSERVAVARPHGELPLQSRLHREESRSLCAAARRRCRERRDATRALARARNRPGLGLIHSIVVAGLDPQSKAINARQSSTARGPRRHERGRQRDLLGPTGRRCGCWPPSLLRFSFPSGLAGPAAHETLLLCGRVVRHRGRDSLGAIKPEF
jgi:hypothetical protein